MRWPLRYLLNPMLALIVIISLAPTVADAKEGDLRASPLTEEIAQRCLTRHMLGNPNMVSSDILTIERQPKSTDSNYVTGYFTNSQSRDFLQHVQNQKLQIRCDNASKKEKKDFNSEVIEKIGSWPNDKDIVITDRCRLGKAYQKSDVVIIQYFCDPVEHRSLAPDRSKWCGGMLGPSGSVAVFKQKNAHLTLEGIGESDSALMAFKCREEKDPR